MKLVIIILALVTLKSFSSNLEVCSKHFELNKLMYRDLLTLSTLDNRNYEGSIVYANDSIMLFIEKGKMSDLGDMEKDIVKLHFSNIKSLTFVRTGNILPAIAYGGLIGGLITTVNYLTKDNFHIGDGLLSLTGGAMYGLAIGGIVGVVLDIDSNYKINGKEVEYLYYLKDFQDKSMYGNNPPPEILKLIK